MPAATKAAARTAPPSGRKTTQPKPQDAVYLPAVNTRRIKPSPDNPRARLLNLEELAASIREQGILEPLILGPAKEGADPNDPRTDFVLIAGHRRHAAAELARIKTVPAIYRPDLTGAKADEARLVENLQRTDLSAIEEARAYERLIRVHGYRQIDVAQAIGRNQGHVSKRLTLLRLPDEAQAAVDAGDVLVNDGVELARLPLTAIMQALDAIKHGTEAPAAIRAASMWADRDADRQAAIKSLQRQRVKLQLSDEPVEWDARTGPIPIQFLDWITPLKHAKMPCYAALIGPAPRFTPDEVKGPVERWATFVCTDPASHVTDDGDDKAEAREIAQANAARKARQERHQQLEAAAKARHVFCIKLVRGRSRIAKTAAYEHIARASVLSSVIDVEYPSQAVFDLAAEWVGLDADTDDSRAGLISMSIGNVPSDQVLRGALALRLATDDVAMSDGVEANAALINEHLRFLQHAGYTPSEVELQLADFDG